MTFAIRRRAARCEGSLRCRDCGGIAFPGGFWNIERCK